MPKSISFCFSGSVTNFRPKTVMRIRDSQEIDTDSLSANDLTTGLLKGMYALSLTDALQACRKSEVEITDYEVNEVG